MGGGKDGLEPLNFFPTTGLGNASFTPLDDDGDVKSVASTPVLGTS